MTTPPHSFINYQYSGVNYDLVDHLKRLAQTAGSRTAHNLKDSDIREISDSRGESAYVVEYEDTYLALVEECLGTKSLVADATGQITGATYYDLLAQDAVAYGVNDLITIGAKPVSLVAYWAIGSSDWFKNTQRMDDLVKGWAAACDIAGVSWGGGETPILKDVLKADAVDLASACFGIVKPKHRLTLGNKLRAGDRIVVFESLGIQSSGVSLARYIAAKLHNGYGTRMKDGHMYGEALLVPTIIYAKLIQGLFNRNVDIHYMANITGHGWRKIMRSKAPFTYRITALPPVPEVFNFMMEQGPVCVHDAYKDLNMGAGFAVFVSEEDTETVIEVARNHNIKAYSAGTVENGPKQVIIEQHNLIFAGDTLGVR